MFASIGVLALHYLTVVLPDRLVSPAEADRLIGQFTLTSLGWFPSCQDPDHLSDIRLLLFVRLLEPLSTWLRQSPGYRRSRPVLQRLPCRNADIAPELLPRLMPESTRSAPTQMV